MKKHLPVFLVGVLGGLFAFSFLAYFIGIDYFLSSKLEAKIKDYYQKDKDLDNANIALAPADDRQKLVADEAMSSVAVQLFQANYLVKQGSGIVLSSDGLIVTTTDLVPPGSYIYQILYDDKITRATVLARDYRSNLALIKISAQDLNVSNLDTNEYQSGQEFVITGKFVNLSKTTTFSQRAFINYVLKEETLLDTAFNNFLNGAKVVDENGRMAGMSYTRYGKVYLIKSGTIDEFLKSQLIKK